jgi:hypothetical protein
VIEHTDQSIGKMVSALKARGLFDSTLIIITAKHAQAPIDRSKRRIIDDTIIPNLVNRVQSGLIALSYADGNITSIWLTDQSQTGKVAETLSQPANQSAAGIQKVLWGESLKLMTNDPVQDIRVPDIVVIPNFRSPDMVCRKPVRFLFQNDGAQPHNTLEVECPGTARLFY